MANEGQLFAQTLEGFWMDVGQPKDFLAGMKLYLMHLKENKDSSLTEGKGIIGAVLKDESAKIGEGCIIGPNVTIGPNCVIEDGNAFNYIIVYIFFNTDLKQK